MNKRSVLATLPALGLAPSTLGVLLPLLPGCTDQRIHAQAVYMLVDTSGTYAQEVDKAQLIVNYLLGNLNSGDSLAVARVRSRRLRQEDLIAKVTFHNRPPPAYHPKR